MDGRGLILRVWNASDEGVRAAVTLPTVKPGRVSLTDVTERDLGETIAHSDHQFAVNLAPRGVATLRIEE